MRPAPRRRRAARRRHRRVLAVVAIVVTAGVAADIVLRLAYAGEILPATRIAGIDVGGISPAAARSALAAAYSGDHAVRLADGGRRFTVSAAEVGHRLDAAASITRAYRAGRDDGPGRVWAALAGLWAERTVAPVVDVDTTRLRAAVAAIARRIDRPPFHGSLAAVGASATPRAVAPRAGRALDRQATARLITTALTRRARRAVALPVRVRPTVTRAHVEAVARAARAYVRRPLTLRAARRTVTVKRGEIAAMLDVEPTGAPAGPPVRLGVDEPGLERLVARLAAEIDRDPVDARLSAPARPVTVDTKGDLTWRPQPGVLEVTPARTGRRLDRAATAAALAAAIRRRGHTARLAIERVPAALTTNAARDVTSILGAFTTRFACCQPRTTNIQLMAKAVDRTVVRPGEQFSLNDVAGPRTRAKGYQPAPFIADGEIVPDVGGGVSQFSTTMYNAAYFAGLRIDRHQPHSFYIDRYPTGREATLDYPGIDLVWTNETQAPVLVRATADATSVTVSLYGASRVRRVEARSGPRVPRDGGGFAVSVTRTVAYRAGQTERQTYTTTYDAPPADG